MFVLFVLINELKCQLEHFSLKEVYILIFHEFDGQAGFYGHSSIELVYVETKWCFSRTVVQPNSTQNYIKYKYTSVWWVQDSKNIQNNMHRTINTQDTDKTID